MHVTEYISVHLCVPEPSPEKNKVNPCLHWKLKKLLSDQISLDLSGLTTVTSDTFNGLHQSCSPILAWLLQGESLENG